MSPFEQLRLGLIGNGISRSSAGNLHRLLGDLHGIEVTYDLMDVAAITDFEIESKLQECARSGFRGVNVTHPYKRLAFAATTPSPSLPAGLTSVNTVVFNGGAMRSDNTDHSGFMRGFRAEFGEQAPGRVLMLGAGGVGIAIAYALARLGAGEILIRDTDTASARTLVHGLKAFGANARNLEEDTVVSESRAVQGLVNATPIGMYQYPGNPFPPDAIGSQRWAFDAVYTPVRTEFMEMATRRGIKTLSGFNLFFYQGLDAFERFSGTKVDAASARVAFLEKYPLEY